MLRHIYITLISILSILNIGAQTEDENLDKYLICRGDILSVRVMDHPEFAQAKILVLPDGYIQYPALGSIYVVGISAVELSDKIKDALDKKYVRNPIVTIYIDRLENQDINIFGKVRKPGVYKIFEPTELLRVLSFGGGVTKIKRSTKVIIVRPSGTVEVIELKKYLRKMEDTKVMIDAGDSIYVKSWDVNWSLLSFLISLATLVVTIM